MYFARISLAFSFVRTPPIGRRDENIHVGGQQLLVGDLRSPFDGRDTTGLGGMAGNSGNIQPLGTVDRTIRVGNGDDLRPHLVQEPAA